MGLLLLIGLVSLSAAFGAMGAGPHLARATALGVLGVVLSYLVVWLTPLPALLTVTLGSTTVYPVWANGFALLAGLAARPFLGVAARRAPTPEERDEAIRQKAMERAKRYQ
jgi:hypothetical protein